MQQKWVFKTSHCCSFYDAISLPVNLLFITPRIILAWSVNKTTSRKHSFEGNRCFLKDKQLNYMKNINTNLKVRSWKGKEIWNINNLSYLVIHTRGHCLLSRKSSASFEPGYKFKYSPVAQIMTNSRSISSQASNIRQCRNGVR